MYWMYCLSIKSVGLIAVTVWQDVACCSLQAVPPSARSLCRLLSLVDKQNKNVFFSITVAYNGITHLYSTNRINHLVQRASLFPWLMFKHFGNPFIHIFRAFVLVVAKACSCGIKSRMVLYTKKRQAWHNVQSKNLWKLTHYNLV